ncbi:hypothetical protein AVEN_20535-1 [Araneus ventricosus]|uniref:Uncharacterized protein n=1 Tax=Araneus ventricosus TaxID=182803 RepID=A0A4Y2HM08_ARAVE|nr:hypothetical protein AVEN_20535-1 [Araneus ventricosus]
MRSAASSHLSLSPSIAMPVHEVQTGRYLKLIELHFQSFRKFLLAFIIHEFKWDSRLIPVVLKSRNCLRRERVRWKIWLLITAAGRGVSASFTLILDNAKEAKADICVKFTLAENSS